MSFSFHLNGFYEIGIVFWYQYEDVVTDAGHISDLVDSLSSISEYPPIGAAALKLLLKCRNWFKWSELSSQ